MIYYNILHSSQFSERRHRLLYNNKPNKVKTSPHCTTFSFFSHCSQGVVLLSALYECTKLLPVNLPVYIYMTNLFGDNKLNRTELIFHVYSIQFNSYSQIIYIALPNRKSVMGGLCTALAKLKTG